MAKVVRRTTLLAGLPTATFAPKAHPHTSAPPAYNGATITQSANTNSNTGMIPMDSQFESLDVIGTGSFGVIRKVRRKADNLILARKELNYGRMDERDLRQLGEEVNILQNLGHNENIVRYYERYVDKQNFMLYILMEYCSQGDLAGAINRCRRDQVHLSEDTVWSYLAQITSALADCHASELMAVDPTTGAQQPQKKNIILHRDIKPENVFLDEHGTVKLGDFGLSKVMEMAAFANTYVGTPYYMSPELINGEHYDVKSDIWSLGCLIYELCAWHPPFHQAQTQPELAKLIREGRIPSLPRGYSASLNATIKQMLRQVPKSRPDTKVILAIDQVQQQIRLLEVQRFARELNRQQASLVERENAVTEREQRVRAREQRFAAEKEAFRLLQQQTSRNVQFTEECENLAPLATEAANQHGSSSASGLTVSEDGLLLQRPLVPSGAGRLSLVPRRPLEERRAANPVAQYAAKRLSLASNFGSPMQIDTPQKAMDLGTLMPQGRNIKSSKSLVNLQQPQLKASDESSKRSAGGYSTGNDSDKDKKFGRQSDSGPSKPPSSPGKKTQLQGEVGVVKREKKGTLERAETMPCIAPLAPPGIGPRTLTAPMTTTNTTAIVPDWELVDNEHLPSPFLRKKPSAPALVAQLLRPGSPKKTSYTILGGGTSQAPVKTAKRLSHGVTLGAKTTLTAKLLSAKHENETRRTIGFGRRESSKPNLG